MPTRERPRAPPGPGRSPRPPFQTPIPVAAAHAERLAAVLERYCRCEISWVPWSELSPSVNCPMGRRLKELFVLAPRCPSGFLRHTPVSEAGDSQADGHF